MRIATGVLAVALVAAASVSSDAVAQAGDAARGRAVAEERGCGTCHGERGRSAMAEVPSLAGQPPEFVTLQLILFREGLRDVPPMTEFARGLTDVQVEDLAAFYAGLPPGPPEDRGPRDAALYARGEALSQQMRCGVCHLPGYGGQQQMPRLAAQREEYLLKSLRDYRDNRRTGTDTNMNAVVYGVPDADLAALAHYLAQTGGG